MKLYSLTVSRLYIPPSIKLAFHYIYLFFCQKMSYLCLKSETLCPVWYTRSNCFPLMWTSFPGCQKIHEAGRMTCESEGFHYQNLKILNVDGVSFKSHQRCLPSSPTKKCQFETVPGVSKSSLGGGGDGSGLLAI